MAVANLDKISNYRHDIPPEPYFVAKLAAVRAGDCGPCTQLVATMAQRAGVDPAALRAVLERDPDALSEDTCLAYEFAEATLAHEPTAGALRERVVAAWGTRGLISLAYAIAAAGIYPMLKYALGHGRSCVLVNVGSAAVPVAAFARA
jgi:alkylhydroperoxidase family enzyme